MSLKSKTILIVIPKNQFLEQELLGTLEVLKRYGPKIVILSKTGQEAVGKDKTRFTPDGMLVDWNKQQGVSGQYDAILIMGGKGAPKSLWSDDILPQILTDHYRADKVIGAIGLGVAVLLRASLATGEASGPQDDKFALELEQAGVMPAPEPLCENENIITASGPEVAAGFAEAVVKALSD